MKILLIRNLFVILIFAPLMLAAQTGGELKKQLEAEKVGVYTRVLSLTADEAKKFWPVFNQFQAEQEKLMKEKRNIHKEVVKNYETMSDKDMEKNLDQMLELEQKELDLKKKYMNEFKKVIPVKKVALIHRAEREFKRQLLKRFRDEREPAEE